MSFLANQINLQEADPLTYDEVSDTDALRKDQISAKILDLYQSFVDPNMSDHLDTMKEIYEHYSDADYETISNFRLSINEEDLLMDTEFGKLETRDGENSTALYHGISDVREDYDNYKLSRENEYIKLSKELYDKSDDLGRDYGKIVQEELDLTGNWYNDHVKEHDDDFNLDHGTMTGTLVTLSEEYTTMSENMDTFSTHNTNQLNSIVDFLDTRFKKFSSELIEHSKDVVNTWKYGQLHY